MGMVGLRWVKPRVALDTVVEGEGWPPELEWGTCLPLLKSKLTGSYVYLHLYIQADTQMQAKIFSTRSYTNIQDLPIECGRDAIEIHLP
jgi:hypothetical protein